MRENVFVPGDRTNRLENLVSEGMPDVNCCLILGYEVWIEIKSPTEPKRPSTSLFGSNHNVSQEQKNWFKEQVDAGGRCYFFIDTDRNRFLVHGKWADALNELTVAQIREMSKWHASKPMRGLQAQCRALRDCLIAPF